MKTSSSYKAFIIANAAFLTLLCLTIIFPFWQQAVISISPPNEAKTVSLHLYTTRPTMDAYREILLRGSVPRAYFWTILRTVLGTFLTVSVSSMLAYPLSRKDLALRKLWMNLILVTMFFGGGLIPTFLLVKGLRLTNTIFALVLPGMCSAYNIIIIRNFFSSLPSEVEESAFIDGANDMQVFLRIILPLSKPILATVTLWAVVGNWNAWFDAMIYISGNRIRVLQILLRDVLTNAEDAALASVSGLGYLDSANQSYTAESIKAAILMATTLPIILVYPFLQKYFVKGIMIGSVKG
jgi:putative aldouronate transport system permease protein